MVTAVTQRRQPTAVVVSPDRRSPGRLVHDRGRARGVGLQPLNGACRAARCTFRRRGGSRGQGAASFGDGGSRLAPRARPHGQLQSADVDRRGRPRPLQAGLRVAVRPSTSSPGGVTARRALRAVEGVRRLARLPRGVRRVQVRRDEGKLLAARRLLRTCGGAECSPTKQGMCSAWLADVDARMPSVILSARMPWRRPAQRYRS